MVFWAILAIMGAWLGFANPIWHFPPAALAFPASLAVLGLSSSGKKQAFRRGFFTGTLASLGCLYWIALPVHDYGYLSWWLAIPCPILVSMYMALYSGLFALAIYQAGRGLPPVLLGILGGFLWAGIEGLREVLFTGFPWLALASAFSPWPEMVQAASLIGANGVGALLAAAAIWLVAGDRKAYLSRFSGLAVLALLAAYGHVQLQKPIPALGTVEAAAIQGNIDQSIKWNTKFQNGTVDRYLALSETAVDSKGAELIIWPETALPFYYQDVTPLSAEVRNFVRAKNVALLTGAPGYKFKPGKKEYDLYNRAYLIPPDPTDMSYYDKEHLLPFGEYVPLADILPFEKLVEGAGDFKPGRSPAPLRHGKLALGTLVCYEAIFPSLAQARVEKGANVLVNISNDAWFGRSSAPVQHLHLSLLRAVEQGRSLIRSTNTGVSAFIDPRGRIDSPTRLFTAAAAVGTVSLTDENTFYHRNYGLVRGSIYIIAAILFFTGLLLTRRVDARRY